MEFGENSGPDDRLEADIDKLYIVEVTWKMHLFLENLNQRTFSTTSRQTLRQYIDQCNCGKTTHLNRNMYFYTVYLKRGKNTYSKKSIRILAIIPLI